MRFRPDRPLARPSRPRRDQSDQRGVDIVNLRRVVGISVLSVTAIQAATASVALHRGRRDYADAVWGPGLAAVAVVGALAGHGDVVRRWGLAVVAGARAARLEIQILSRIGGSDDEDPQALFLAAAGGSWPRACPDSV